MESPYNRKPKGNHIERNYEVRLANVRRALSTMDERIEKLRTEKINNKPPTGFDAIIAAVCKGMNQS